MFWNFYRSEWDIFYFVEIKVIIKGIYIFYVFELVKKISKWFYRILGKLLGGNIKNCEDCLDWGINGKFTCFNFEMF